MKKLFLLIAFTVFFIPAFCQSDSISLAGKCFCKKDGLLELIVNIKKGTAYMAKLPYYEFRTRQYEESRHAAEIRLLLNPNKKDPRTELDSLNKIFLFILQIDLWTGLRLPSGEVKDLLSKLMREDITFLRELDGALEFKNPLDHLEEYLRKYRNE